MSPIIKEPDDTEHIPLSADNSNTPFPEDINIQANEATSNGTTGNARKISVTNSAEEKEVSKSACTADKKKSIKMVQKINNPLKNEGVLKRSQSLRTRITPYDHQNGNKISLLQTKTPPSEESDSSVSQQTKQTKSGKFKMFKNRWSMFPKYSAQDNEDKQLYNLRRSQSMKIPSKISQTVSSLMPISENPSTPSNKTSKQKSGSKYDIKNSKSLIDIRQLAKKDAEANKNAKNKSFNSKIKIKTNDTDNNKILSRKLSLNLDIEKEPTAKNFAHKTIDVIRKSVQGKLKGNLDKQNKKKQENINTNTNLNSNSNNISNTNSCNENSLKKVNKVDILKTNSKRKKIDCDYDPEFKPKKKVSSAEKDKIKSVTIAKPKANGVDNFSSSKNLSKGKHIEEAFVKTNNRKNDKTILKSNNNKTLKDNKNNELNITNKKQLNNVDNAKNNNNFYQYESNGICYSGKIPSASGQSYTIQNHHVLFLNNIHETLNNSCKLKTETSPISNIHFQEAEPLKNHQISKIFPMNLIRDESMKLRCSFPLLFNKNIPNESSENVKPSSLMKSFSETCINEKTLLMFQQDINAKSSSPMSISNCDGEIVKNDEIPSAFICTDNYDPYIDETMDEFLYEGEGETHFGSLFTENKSSWKDFTDNFKLDLDFNSGSYYFDGIDDSLDTNFKSTLFKSNFVPNTSSLNFEESNSLHDHSPTSLPSNGEVKIYDSRKAADLQFCSLQSKDFKFSSENSLESTNTLESTGFKCPIIPKKQKDILSHGKMASSKKYHSVPGKPKNNIENTVNKNEIKQSKNKPLDSVTQTNETQTKRKVLKYNQRENPLISPNRSKKLKENTKITSQEEIKLPPNISNSKIRKKSLSENFINNKTENETSLRKEKSEVENFKKEEKLQKNDNNDKNEGKLQKNDDIDKKKTASLISIMNNNEEKNIIKTDHKNEDSTEPRLISRSPSDVSVNSNQSQRSSNSYQPIRNVLNKNIQNSRSSLLPTYSSAASGPIAPHGRTPGRVNRPLPDRAISRLSTAPDVIDEKKCQDLSLASTRRSKIDNSKASLTKTFRGAPTRTKQTDPVKILRPTAPNGQTPAQIPTHISDQLKKLEAELSARTQEAQSAREEVSRANRGLEALTVLVHYLTNEYNAFATPKLKAEVERLSSQLTDVRLCLDESTAAAQRLETEAAERCQKHEEVVRNLEETHRQEISSITLEHQRKLEEVLEKHNQELQEIVNRETCKYESLVKSHNEELDRIDKEWRTELDKQHERHLHALEQLNSCHTQQLRDTEESWKLREQALQENNVRLLKEQASLKQQAKKLEETLLSDKDHRLQAAKRVCTALQNEVDSLKTVVDMRNSEVHKLRDQLADKERISEELDCAKDRVRALQAKTEDLHAQMETKLQLERQLLSDRHSLSDSLQREASINKRLSLENEELQWKLRQREAHPNATHSTSTLDLVTRCSSGLTRQQDGCKTGVLSPQFTPRSQRIGTKPHDKKWSQSFSNIPEDAGKLLRRAELQQQQHDNVTIKSPPTSPRVKAVIEKSNSVSFILDLNDTFPDEPFLGAQSYHHGVKPRTPILQRKSLTKSYSHNLEKSRSASLVQGNSKSMILHRDSRDLNGKSPKERANGIKRDKINGECNSMDCENDTSKRSSKYRTHSTSESSDSGDIERISPTGLSWTVPVHSNMKRYSKHIPNNRFQLVPEPPRLLQQPDEDEYEENENEFVEVLALGDDINSAPLTMLFGQAPSTSVSLGDSDVSQCGSRADLSSSDDDDDDGTLLQKEGQSRPLEGAGEAMIFPDVFGLKRNDESCKSIPKSQISSAPSSDSEDANQATHAEEPLNMSWSEDAECDLTSSSEMQELL